MPNTNRRLRLLHLSDLHLGKDEGSPSRWRQRRVMGEAWLTNLRDISKACHDHPIDLICFTGDLAQSGQPEQYEQAREFVEQLLEHFGLPKERFFCVPGNHDVDRDINKPMWKKLRNAAFAADPLGFAKWIAGSGSVPLGMQGKWRDAVLARQQAYRDFLKAMGLDAQLPENSAHSNLGYRIPLDLGLSQPLNVVGFDSAWLAGDDHDAAKLRLTDEQIGRLLPTDESAWTIGLVHHPIGELADGGPCLRLMIERGLSLLLHGHLHSPDHEQRLRPEGQLRMAAAGCLYESDRYPNAMQVLDLRLSHGQPVQLERVYFRAWSARGFWHRDNGLFPGTQDGCLHLLPTAPVQHRFTPGAFIGRDAELTQLHAALLPTEPDAAPRPTVLCCVMEGMPGVGKTRLAEHFVQQHWLGAGDASELLQRLTLDPQTDAAPEAAALGQRLADSLRSTGTPETLWARLQSALLQGPHGRRRLVLIENVDTPAQANAVAALVHALPGCAVLVTARYAGLGRAAGWTRIPLKPMPASEGAQLLLAEVASDGYPLTPAEAESLSATLGGLPLALHIAASHLSQGLSPDHFRAELSRKGLDLAPADLADPRLLGTERARAILSASFRLSRDHWRAFCGRQPERTAWLPALVALAHGPISACGLSLAAAMAGLGDEDGEFLNFAIAAAQHGLLEHDRGEGRVSLHALLAEYLRSEPMAGVDADAVRHRIGNWFLPRLPETGNEQQGRAWGAVDAETPALLHWLAQLPLEEGLVAEQAGSHYAVTMGPYGAWQAFCEGLVCQAPAAKHLSSLYWTLGNLARRGGDPTTALQAAALKGRLDLQQGWEREAALAAGLRADVLQAKGQLDEALRIRREDQLPVFERLGDVRSRAITLGRIADVLQTQGQLDEALRIRREEELPVYERLGDVRERAITLGKIADVLQAQGQLDEVLRIRREEELPVYERLGEVRSRAITLGKIADVLQAQGQLDEVLRIRREEELPVYERLGDVRSRAIALGQIADVLQDQGQLDEALRIRREEELPVYERLGDVRSRAIALGQIADVLQAQGQLNEALRIRREEELPVYERLGDVRSHAVTLGKIADVLQAQGQLDEALRIRREKQLPVFERLCDVRERAITLGKIADMLQDQGQLDEALRIRREEELPVYERLGDVRERAVTLGRIANVLQAQGQLGEALRIRREEELPVYARLGDARALLVGRANLALTLRRLERAEDGDEIALLLRQAHAAAVAMRLPEVEEIEAIFLDTFGQPLTPDQT